MTEQEFSQTELLENAQGNLQAFIVTGVAYLKQQGGTVEEWVTFIGSKFAPSWEEMRGKGAREVAQHVALNALATGGQLESLSGDESQAKVTVSNWLQDDFLELAGTSRSDLDPFWSIFRPITDHLGFDYEYESQGNSVTLTLRKR